jgi:hypothetical protein
VESNAEGFRGQARLARLNVKVLEGSLERVARTGHKRLAVRGTKPWIGLVGLIGCDKSHVRARRIRGRGIAWSSGSATGAPHPFESPDKFRLRMPWLLSQSESGNIVLPLRAVR